MDKSELTAYIETEYSGDYTKALKVLKDYKREPGKPGRPMKNALAELDFIFAVDNARLLNDDGVYDPDKSPSKLGSIPKAIKHVMLEQPRFIDELKLDSSDIGTLQRAYKRYYTAKNKLKRITSVFKSSLEK